MDQSISDRVTGRKKLGTAPNQPHPVTWPRTLLSLLKLVSTLPRFPQNAPIQLLNLSKEEAMAIPGNPVTGCF